MSARDGGAEYQDYFCPQCQGFGKTMRAEVVMGMGLFLTAGVAHRIVHEEICPHCCGSGFYISPQSQAEIDAGRPPLWEKAPRKGL